MIPGDAAVSVKEDLVFVGKKVGEGAAYGAGAVVGGAKEVGGAVKDGAVAAGEAVGKLTALKCTCTAC